MTAGITDIDRVILKGRQAWHSMGIVIEDELTAVEAGVMYKMFWDVDRWALVAIGPNGEQIPVDTHVANVRMADANGQDIRHLLGIVGADYQICQNRELAEFTDALASTGKVVIESCGSIRGGKRVWFLARGDAFTIGSPEDKAYPYLLVSNGHDGAQSIRVTPTTIWVVCQNTLHQVIPQTDILERPDSAAITIRHTGKIADKLEQAKRALAYYGDTLRRNKELWEIMQAKKIDQTQALQLFSDCYSSFWEVATPEELASTDKKVQRIAENRMARMRRASDVFMERYEKEKDVLHSDDNMFRAFNAMSGFIQHDYRARGADDVMRVERRVESNLFGINATRTHEALAAAMALAS